MQDHEKKIQQKASLLKFPPKLYDLTEDTNGKLFDLLVRVKDGIVVGIDGEQRNTPITLGAFLNCFLPPVRTLPRVYP